MSYHIIPGTANTYYLNAAGTPTATSGFPAAVTLSTATYTASTRTLTQVGVFANALAGDVLQLTSGVTAGFYTIQTKVSSDSVILATSASIADATGVSGGTTINSYANEGYLRNPARSCLANAYVRIGRFDISLLSLYFISPSATPTTDNFKITTSGNSSVLGGMSFTRGSVTHTDIFVPSNLEPIRLSSAYCPLFVNSADFSAIVQLNY